MKVRRVYLLIALLALVASLLPFRAKVRSLVVSTIQFARGKKTVSDRVAEFSNAVHKRLLPYFDSVGTPYPPRKVILVALKQEQTLEVWVAGDDDIFKLLRTYTVLAASGGTGPKLREGDGQVPEGLYFIESLNPNSLYHVSLRVNYPNNFDKQKAKLDQRENLGSDIMIHGKSVSIGCLAMGDEAAEDLFVLAAEVGIQNVRVILSPADLRVRSISAPRQPAWTTELYEDIRRELAKLSNSHGQGVNNLEQ